MTGQSSSPLTDRVEDGLRNALKIGTYQRGDKLPSERQLSASYNVGRVPVRTALARLAADGMVESRRGAGYYVLRRRRKAG